MIEVKSYELGRALYFHKLNVSYTCDWVKPTECHGKFSMGYETIATEVHIIDYAKGDKKTTMVSERFKSKYIDTVPDNAWRCRTCSLNSGCKIIRGDQNDFCTGWRKG